MDPGDHPKSPMWFPTTLWQMPLSNRLPAIRTSSLRPHRLTGGEKRQPRGQQSLPANAPPRDGRKLNPSMLYGPGALIAATHPAIPFQRRNYHSPSYGPPFSVLPALTSSKATSARHPIAENDHGCAAMPHSAPLRRINTAKLLRSHAPANAPRRSVPACTPGCAIFSSCEVDAASLD